MYIIQCIHVFTCIYMYCVYLSANPIVAIYGRMILVCVLLVLLLIQDYDLCSSCYQKIGHEHPMEKLGFNMGDEDPKSSSASNTVSRLEMQQRRNEFLIHACQCRDSSCSKQLCIKMKQLLRHARDCKMRTSGKCTACNFFIKLCVTHSQECRENKCPVPFCANLKKKMWERRLMEQAKSYQLACRRIMAMNRLDLSPTNNSANETNPSPSPPTPHSDQMIRSVSPYLVPAGIFFFLCIYPHYLYCKSSIFCYKDLCNNDGELVMQFYAKKKWAWPKFFE